MTADDTRNDRTGETDELAYASVVELSRRLIDRDLSPVELLDRVLERIETRNPDLNAVVHLAGDEARDAARRSERRLLTGEPLGPLEGIPTMIKDLYDFKPGWPATFGGVPALADQVIDAYCVFAERVEQAGAIIVGKTNSPSMGLRGTCDNLLFGPSRNPFDRDKNTGGSSGGSAAAVADGFVPFAEGTDAGGSIRIPAAWCGVYGHKPGWGRVPVRMRPNAFAGTYPFVAEGPITRTVSDAALVLSVLSGHDPHDPYSLDQLDDPRDGLIGDLRGRRVAYSPDFGVYPVDPQVRATVTAAVSAFEEAGATVEEVEIRLPYDHRELADLWCRMMVPLNIANIDKLRGSGIDLFGAHRSSLSTEYLERIEGGDRFTIMDIARDQVMRTVVTDAIERVFESYDLLVTPTVAALPVDNAHDGNTLGPAEVDGQPVERLIGWCLTYFLNFSGHPAASVPAGLVGDRWPVGMQVIGRRHDDVGVIRASRVFEETRPWTQTYQLCRDRPVGTRPAHRSS